MGYSCRGIPVGVYQSAYTSRGIQLKDIPTWRLSAKWGYLCFTHFILGGERRGYLGRPNTFISEGTLKVLPAR
ncbi:MAG: hypothetical protein LBF22_11535 [Deltaproteobacteria bacterium]|nr:hypothetical protein [Deltaproteobacteria bacterium]